MYEFPKAGGWTEFCRQYYNLATALSRIVLKNETT